MENTAQETPLAVTLLVSAVLGFITAAALLLWLQQGPAILLDLSGLSAAFICM